MGHDRGAEPVRHVLRPDHRAFGHHGRAGNQEPYPNTPTFTFVNAKYTSKYLTFTSVEGETNIPDTSTGGYTALQTPTSAQQALLTKYDAAPYTTEAGAIPFLDFGNKYVSIGVSYPNTAIQGLTWSQIATDLHNPNSTAAKAVDGTANYFTAAICKMTGNQPASACTPAVQALESQLRSAQLTGADVSTAVQSASSP